MRSKPPPVKWKKKKRCRREAEYSPPPDPADKNYDGYYDDVPVGDDGRQTLERFEPELIKRIALIAGGAVVIVILCILVMYLL
jgi:hypothetical protein